MTKKDNNRKIEGKELQNAIESWQLMLEIGRILTESEPGA
jgi:hypothetical protein